MGLTGCGDNGSPQGSGQLALVVKGADPLLSKAPRRQAARYKVVVSGADFVPITVEVPAEATSATIEGIPVGSNRTVSI